MILQSQEARTGESIPIAALGDESKVYFSYDTLMEEAPLERAYLDEDSSQFRVQRFNDTLNANSEFQFFTYGAHVLEAYISNASQDMLYAGNKNTLKAHQVNENLITQYPISMLKGRSFFSDDFLYNSLDRIPVILGNNYSELYDVGSRIKGIFMIKSVTLEVIGIARKGTFFPLSDTLEYEDSYIIMPALRIVTPPINEQDDFLQKIIALQNSSGFFRLTKDQPLGDLVRYLNLTKDQYGMYGVRLGRMNAGRLLALGLSSKNQREIYMGLAGVIVAYSFIILMVVLNTSVRRNARRFCILFIAGGSKTYIASIVILEATSLSMGAFLLSMLFTFFIGCGEISIHYFSSCVLFVAGMLCTVPALHQLFRSPVLYLKKY